MAGGCIIPVGWWGDVNLPSDYWAFWRGNYSLTIQGMPYGNNYQGWQWGVPESMEASCINDLPFGQSAGWERPSAAPILLYGPAARWAPPETGVLDRWAAGPPGHS